jgi:hypothetical protein
MNVGVFRFSHAADEASIQSIILISFSSRRLLSCVVFPYISLSAGTSPQLHSTTFTKYLFGDKVSSTRIFSTISYRVLSLHYTNSCNNVIELKKEKISATKTYEELELGHTA